MGDTTAVFRDLKDSQVERGLDCLRKWVEVAEINLGVMTGRTSQQGEQSKIG